MFLESIKSMSLLLVFLLLALAACNIISMPQENKPLSDKTSTSVTATSLPTAGLTPGQTPAHTQSDTNPLSPTVDHPSATLNPGLVINSQNAANLVKSKSLELPEWPTRLIWPAETLDLSGFNSRRPIMLINSISNIYPVYGEPLEIGPSIPLPIDGNNIVSIAPDGTSMVVQNPSQSGLYTMDGKLLWIIHNPQQLYGADYSSDNQFLSVTSTDERAATIFTADGKEIKKLTGFETAAPVYSAIIAPGGKTAAWIARATLQFQDVETGLLSNQINFEDFIGSILFTPDGQRLALYAAGKLMIYDPLTGEEITHLTLSEPLRDLEFSPDGKLLVGIYGQSLQFWDGQTLTPVTSIPVAEMLIQLSFSPEGRQIVTVSDDQKLMFWHLP